MRAKIVAGNWKMNQGKNEGLALASEVIHILKDEMPARNTEVYLAPPFLHIPALVAHTKGMEKLGIAAQNCASFEDGAYTGEVSASMLQSFGTQAVLIGHSERRQYFNETSADLAKKVDLALKHGIKPIFCCGEALEIRESGKHIAFVCQQLSEALFHLSPSDFAQVVVAYEPIWAIGTGKTASAAQAQEMHAALRAHLASHFGKELAEQCRILYGGSCKGSNAAELFAGKDVDGGLIGGASLKAREFVDIVMAAEASK